MVLPLYASLEKMDDSLIEAATDLGCPPTEAFWKITFPLSLPGVVAGCLLVFIPAVGEFVIPDLLGGSQTLMIGKTLWNEFFPNRDWPVASAVAVILLLVARRADHALPERAGQRAGAGPNERQLEPLQHHLDRRSALPSSICRSCSWSIFSFNDSQAGHGLGRLLDQLVRVSCSTTRACWTPPG